MTNFEEFEEVFDSGLKGEHKWIPLSQPKLNAHISLGKSMYILFGGIPGSGKTAIVDSVFVLDIYDWWYENQDKVDILPTWVYRSMERAKFLKIAKWTCYRLYKLYGLLLDVPTILQWANKKRELTAEEIQLIKAQKPYFDRMEERVHIIAGAENPTGVWKDALAFTHERGREIKKTINIGGGKTKEIFSHFEYTNPNEILIHVTDHIGKLKAERGFDVKQTLDKHSEFMGILRDMFNWTIIDISQLNRGIMDTYRNVNTDIDIMPQDFKGTANVYENADIVMGLMNPYKLAAFEYMGYDIKKFVTPNGYNRFRALKVIKNSYGIDDFRIGYQFLGEIGGMKELPTAENFNLNLADYKDYI